MKMNRSSLVLLLIAALTLLPVMAGISPDEELTSNLQRAKKEKKSVLLCLMGYSWCACSKQFKNEVLYSPDFADLSKESLVVAQFDVPNDKQKVTPETYAIVEMAKKHKMTEAPTLILLDADGKELGRQSGYTTGSSAEFLTKIKGFLKKAK